MAASEVKQAFQGSLCLSCEHRREVRTERSVFLRCVAPSEPKYKPQPVRACPSYEPESISG